MTEELIVLKRFCRILSPKDIWLTECGLEVGEILGMALKPDEDDLFFIKDGKVLKDPQGDCVWTNEIDIQEGFLEIVEEGELPWNKN